jgi:hypothetical protein
MVYTGKSQAHNMGIKNTFFLHESKLASFVYIMLKLYFVQLWKNGQIILEILWKVGSVKCIFAC